MKIAAKNIETFLKTPDSKALAILIYGPDSGLVRQRASILGKHIVEDLNDPFNAATLNNADLAQEPGRLSDEANTVSMMGGRRLIMIPDASDKLAASLNDYLENPNPEALVILQAGDLNPRSSLRKLCESAGNAAALPCYVDDERSLQRLIKDHMSAHQIRIEHDAVLWLSANINGDRLKVMQELDKLVIYKHGDPTPLNLEDVQICCGEAGTADIDQLLYSLGQRSKDAPLKALDRLFSDNVNFVIILRSLQEHFRKLSAVLSLQAAGQAIPEAMKTLGIRIFFKQESAFQAQLQRWSLQRLERVLDQLNQLEAACKKTGAPVETLCAQFILSLHLARR